MNRLVSRPLVLALALVAGSAAAQDAYAPDYRYDDRGYAYDDRDYGYDDRDYGYDARRHGAQGPAWDLARVTRVDPIVERGEPVTRRECWREPAPAYAGRGYRDPYGDPRYPSRDPRRPTGNGALLGAIVGGVLGNTVGDGDGRRAATVVGAVVGGAVGNDIERKSRERDYGYHDAGYRGPAEVERCRLVSDGRADHRVVGYRVGYEYAGREYETITDHHPGRDLRVRVHVTPEG